MMRDGDRIRVTYTVLDPETKREWRDLVEGSVSNLFGVQDDVADSVARNLDLGRAQRERAALDPAVSQRRYLEALGHLRRYDKRRIARQRYRDPRRARRIAVVCRRRLARAYLLQVPDHTTAAIRSFRQ